VAPYSSVTVESILGTIVLTGTVRDADDAKRITDIANLFSDAEVQNHMIVVGEQQVLLRVTIAEMNRQATRQLGVNGFLAGDDFQDIFALSNIGGINPSNIGAAAGVNAQSTIPFLTGEGGIPIGDATTFSLGFPRVQLQLFIQALRDNGLARILAEPNLVAISGQSAEFLAGGEFPIPVPQGGAGGSTSITIDYREFGAQLRFQPTVIGDDRIRMVVNPIVSELDFTNAVNLTGFVVPGLTERSVETTIEVGNGQTILIAGLLSDQVRANASRIPGLGDMPVLGALFRSVRYQRSITELVVMVTPEIVAPLNPDQVPQVPGADIVGPNDWELYGLGVLEAGQDPLASGLYPPKPPQPQQVAPVAPAPSDAPQGGHAGPQGAVDAPTGQSAHVTTLNLFGPWGPSNGVEEKAGVSGSE
jgi:pilus assembly protein CpaC